MPQNLNPSLAAVPQIIVEVGFTSNPLDPIASQSWTDISQYVMSFNTNIGRQHELSRVEAGKAQLTLNNADARFDPFNTSSPYNPNVVPAKRLRIRAVWNSITYAVFMGFIESWGEQWPNANAAFITVTVVDAFKMLNLKTLLTPYAQAVLGDSPEAYYRMHESSTRQSATDSGPNQYTAVYVGSPTFGAPGPVNDGTVSAVLFNGATADAMVMPFGPTVSGTAAFSAECFFGTTAPSYFFRQSSGTTGWTLSINTTITFQTFDGGSTQTLNPAGSYNDGKWHHLVATRAAGGTLTVYVDGASIGSSAVASNNIQSTPVLVGNAPPGSGSIATWSASMSEIGLYNVALNSTQVSAHYAAASSWANDLSGTRVQHVLAAVGWPTADQSLEAGQSTLQADPAPGNALANLTDTADSENGLFFQAPSGVLTFFQRSHLWTATASLVPQATFGDAAGEEPYILAGLRPFMDDLDLFNDVQATRIGGVLQEAQDSTSQTSYGQRTLVVSNLKVAADRDALSRAQYDLSRYKTPLTRVRGFTVKPLSNPTTLYPQVLGRSLWDRVTFKRRPPGGGTLFNQDSIIEGIAHDYTPGLWKTTFALSPVDANANQYFVLDSATLGVLDTNKLAY